MGRADLKKKTLEAIEKQKKEEEQGNNFKKSFQHPCGERGYMNIDKDDLSLFRVVLGGDPNNEETLGQQLSPRYGEFFGKRDHQANPGENMLFAHGWLNNDSGKNQPVTLPSLPTEYKDHLLVKAIKALSAYTYDAEAIDPKTNKKGVKTFKFAGEEISKRVLFNGKPNDKFPKSMLDNIKPRVIMNVIDRLDPAFHEETGMCKIATDSAYTNGDGKLVAGDPCIGLPMYSSILAKLNKEHVTLDETDIAIFRYSQKTKPKGQDSYLDIYDAVEDIKKAWNTGEKENPGEGAYTKMVRDKDYPYTEHPDDAKLKLVDLSKFEEVTPYKTIQRGFKKIFEEADRLTGSDFVAELEKLVEQEAHEAGAKKAEEADYEAPEDIPKDKVEDKPAEAPEEKKADEPKEESAPARGGRGARGSRATTEAPKEDEVKEVTFEEFSKLTTDFKGIDSLDADDKKYVKFFSNGTLVMVDDKGNAIAEDSNHAQPCKNGDCSFKPSIFLYNCPVCGTNQE